MEQQIHITLGFDLATGKVNLNEIVYCLEQLKNPLMLRILKKILTSYDDLIAERLSHHGGVMPPSKMRKGLGRHIRKGDPKSRFCHGRRIRKRGYRKRPRIISTVFGKLELPIRVAECRTCGARHSPLLDALKLMPYCRKESNFEQQVIEAVIDTNYRRLIDGRSIDISLGGIHNIVVGSDVDQLEQEPVDLDDLSAIMADGTGYKRQKGKKGELRSVIGITTDGKVEPLGTFANTQWSDIERIIKDRLKKTKASGIPFIYDGEPGLDDFLSDVAQPQRCVWHGPRGLYHSLWEDGVKKKDSQPFTDKLKHLIGVELPQTDYELIKEKDKQAVEEKYQSSKVEILQLIKVFNDNGYYKGAVYLENLSQRMFTNIEIWLKTGVIAPKTTSLLERIFREIGRRVKRIAWGWSDAAVTKLSKMIVLKKYSKEKWQQYRKKKLGIQGNFRIQLVRAETSPCHNF
ncbi:MAG: transposase [Deltaproteobacteria bacterium]|nr:transposase [Deltaproteobacteria bacterium]